MGDRGALPKGSSGPGEPAAGLSAPSAATEAPGPLKRKQRRYRTTFSNLQLEQLEREGGRAAPPGAPTNPFVFSLKVWFQNRRAKWRKREKTEMLGNVPGLSLTHPLGMVLDIPLSQSPLLDHAWRSMPLSTIAMPSVTPAFSPASLGPFGLSSLTENTILPLSTSMVHPHLEYCMQMWSTYLKKDIWELEKVQKRTTKIIRGMEWLPYGERLIRLGFFTSERDEQRGI
uniref:Homeobox domain-containing protein n=1 Tax=Gopherus evgoodei TaxID=1825980 RepID=A0A8C4WH04_9SAUR